MAFTNFIFLFVFFPLCIGGYLILWFIQRKFKKENLRFCDIFLVLASPGFYGWAGLQSLLYLCLYMLLVYALGRSAGKTVESGNKRGITARIAIVALVGILYFCKYFAFTVTILNKGLHTSFEAMNFLAPLGISFITFSAISYIMDIYRGDSKPGSLLDVVLYLSFFPKVVSGPIVLWKDFSLQVKGRKLDDGRFMEGLNRIMLGYAKKVILADTFGAAIVDIQQKLAAGMDMPTAWFCALLYMLEIYYDFAGYSDIALGLAQLFGFSFKENFNFPYVSASITEFWRRWHISLGIWFREYIYFSLGGNRKGRSKTLINLFIVFLITGIWHGAGWHYILWGGLNGVCVIVERCVRDKKLYQQIPYVIKWAATMFIVLISWEIFRLPAGKDILGFFEVMFGIVKFQKVDFTIVYFLTPKLVTFVAVGVLGATVLHHKRLYALGQRIQESKVLFVFQEIFLFSLMVLSFIFMVNSTYSPFIYFQY